MSMPLSSPPTATPVREEEVWAFYLNIEHDLEQCAFSDQEKAHLYEYYREAGLLRAWRRPFFRHHFSRTFCRAVNHLFSSKRAPTIVDLGCGTGSQALYFALLGARVIAIDMDSLALGILKKRVALYESRYNVHLDIQVRDCSAFDLDYGAIAPIDGIFSLFAFNLMRPPVQLLAKLFRFASDDCRLAILDGNVTSWKARLVPRSKREGKLSPREFEDILVANSLRIDKHLAGFAIPPVLWCMIPSAVLQPLDDMLGRVNILSISHQILASK